MKTPPTCKKCGGEGRVYVFRPKVNKHILVPCPLCAVDAEEDKAKKELESLLE